MVDERGSCSDKDIEFDIKGYFWTNIFVVPELVLEVRMSKKLIKYERRSF